jgi:hypothetical protein
MGAFCLAGNHAVSRYRSGRRLRFTVGPAATTVYGNWAPPRRGAFFMAAARKPAIL